MNDPVSPSALNDFVDGVSDRLPEREDYEKVREYYNQLGLLLKAKVGRIVGEHTVLPPEPDPPDCLPELTRPIEEIRQDILDRAARLGTEEDGKRE